MTCWDEHDIGPSTSQQTPPQPIHTIKEYDDEHPNPALRWWQALSADCQKGLTDALRVGSNASDAAASSARLAALDRALAAKDTLTGAVKGTSTDWTLVAAIGIRETGFRNINQPDGMGVGVFQIDLGQNPGVTKDQASSISFAANWAAKYLESAAVTLSGNEALILTGTDPWLAAAAAYNHGVTGVLRDIQNGIGPDARITGHNYGSNVMNIKDCFR